MRDENVNGDRANGVLSTDGDLTIIRPACSCLDSSHVSTEEARLKYRYLICVAWEMAQRLKPVRNHQPGCVAL